LRELEGELAGIGQDRVWRIEEAVEGPSMHEVGAHETGESERAADGFGEGLCEADEQIGNEGDGDLDADGIL
jgi:hypothetical protein